MIKWAMYMEGTSGDLVQCVQSIPRLLDRCDFYQGMMYKGLLLVFIAWSDWSPWLQAVTGAWASYKLFFKFDYPCPVFNLTRTIFGVWSVVLAIPRKPQGQTFGVDLAVTNGNQRPLQLGLLQNIAKQQETK